MENFKLYYASIKQFEEGFDIPCFEFESFEKAIQYVNDEIYPEYDYNNNRIEYKEEKVYLFTFQNEIFITHDVCYLDNYIHNSLCYFNEFCEDRELYLQEYPTYEDAYESALEMKEYSKLCYNKDLTKLN